MTSKESKRHTELARPHLGQFGRNEWAILGAKCDVIKDLADTIIRALAREHACAYIDAVHHDDAPMPHGRLAAGAELEYIEHQQFRQFNDHRPCGKLQHNLHFNDCDLVLVNGNHHQAEAQVVIIDVQKIESLKKRAEQLTNVQMILVADNAEDIFDFVKAKNPGWQELPVYGLQEKDKIIDFFKARLKARKPPLNGLVLAGGKSTRLGIDKTLLDWHGMEQKYFIAQLLSKYCDDVFISAREDWDGDIDGDFKVIRDQFIGLGPYGGILSAFRQFPGHAWLVVASDLPLLDADTLSQLCGNRKTSAIATTFESPHDALPEPLVSIWEPNAYQKLLSFLGLGISCPRKVLMNNNTNIIKPFNPTSLMNVNTKEDFEKAKDLMKHT